MRLHLVRHGAPLIDQDREPASWDLDPAGHDDIDRLLASGVLPDDARWISSTEPKALQTAERLTSTPVLQVEQLGEQRRPNTWVKDFAIHIHRALVTEDMPVAEGWEPARETRSRITDAVARLEADADGQDLVLVGHSTPWLLLVSELTGAPVDLAAWERLLMPDHCILERGVLVQGWGAWREDAAS
ncbi:histidine phosphatase family protein [Saxibacter everestensis]|uniref:Histidine phosphatase family protein n=1 Tax=Saxibacter everestensis TaxID=2909229 RepID=A0ABY8QVV1_9MICO|nr:histidine phosphatase family protein [Brevibacteriaceae bacterium ZFBP1038]